MAPFVEPPITQGPHFCPLRRDALRMQWKASQKLRGETQAFAACLRNFQTSAPAPKASRA
jgi:hypothetical protein